MRLLAGVRPFGERAANCQWHTGSLAWVFLPGRAGLHDRFHESQSFHVVFVAHRVEAGERRGHHGRWRGARIPSSVRDARNLQPYLSFRRAEHGSCAVYDRFAIAPSAKTLRRMEFIWHAMLFPG